MTNLSLAMIVKDEEEGMKRILPKVKPFVDEIVIVDTGSKDKTIEIAKEHGAKVYNFKWIDDFSAARNFMASKVKTKYYLWLDGDDDVVGIENLQKYLDTNPDMLLVRYDYGFDEDGNPIAVQWRDRILRTDYFEWKNKIHESPVPKGQMVSLPINDFVVKHVMSDEDNLKKLKRNMKVLVDETKNKKVEEIDPRSFYYIATSAFGIATSEHNNQMYELTKFYSQLLYEHSGWNEERYRALCLGARASIALNEYKEAADYCYTALDLQPNWGEAYFILAEAYYFQGEWDKVIEWTNVGFTKGVPKTISMINPMDYSIRPLPFVAHAYLNKGNIDRAYQLMSVVAKKAPSNIFIKDFWPAFKEAKLAEDFVKSYLKIDEYLTVEDPSKRAKLLEVVPKFAADDSRLDSIRKSITKPQVWADDTVTIYCGKALEDWSPLSLITGIGGSEEAVINMARELQKNGKKVTVYNSCGNQEGEYDDVVYKNWWTCDLRDTFNMFIAWRNPFVGPIIKAKTKWCWLHDVPAEAEWTEERRNAYDKILVLSQYHRSLLPNIPDDKFFITSNGIDPTHFEVEVERNPKQCIYTSSPDRGLRTLLELWPKVLEKEPEAKLLIRYGWNNFDKVHKGDPTQEKWKAEVEEMIQSMDSVSEFKRVGHKKLAKEMLGSGVWVYPTQFEEINCISAQKAQAASCFCVTTGIYAQEEFVKERKYVVNVNDIYTNREAQEQFVENIIKAMNDGERYDGKKYQEEFSWEVTCKNWLNQLNENTTVA